MAKVTAHGLAHWLGSGGFAPLERQKCCWNWITQAAAVWGSEEEEQQLYNFIYATVYLLSPHPSHPERNTHIFSQLENTLFKAVLLMAASCRPSLCIKRKVEHRKKAPHAWSGCIATNDTTQPQHDTSGTELCTERCPFKQCGWRKTTQRMFKRCSFSPDLWLVSKVYTASVYLNTPRLIRGWGNLGFCACTHESRRSWV